MDEDLGLETASGTGEAAGSVPAPETVAPIRTESADGVIHEFPASTPPEVVDKAMKEYSSKNANKTSTLGQMGRGFMDPIEGGGQLLSNLAPTPVRETLDQFNNWVAKRSGGLIRELPAGGKNEQMQAREAEITQERGIDRENIDWSRMAGDVLNPVNYIGGGLLGGASRLANVGRGVLGGAVAGGISPVANPEYWTEKAKQLGVGVVLGGATGAAINTVSKGINALGEWLVRKNPEVLENAAVAKVMKRIAQDEKTGSPSATDMLDIVNAADRPMTIADIGGANVKGLAGNAARQPGEARNFVSSFLSKRDDEAAQRLGIDIDKYVHGGETAHQATEGLLSARSAAARPAYEASEKLQGVWSPRLQEFLEDPSLKAGLARGYELERLQALAEGRPLSAKQLGVDLDTEGNIKMLDVPNMRLLDMGKKGLDAMIADERNTITGRLSQRGLMLDQVRRAYIGELDSLDTSGLYRKARETWAGYSASMDAIKLGRAVFTMNPEEAAKELGKMSAPNRAFYNIGVADTLKERMAKVGLSGDEAKALIKNPWMRDQLRPAFKSTQEFDQFVDAVTNETKMFETGRKVLGGSQTAERVAEDTSGQGVERALAGGRAVGEFASGHPIKGAIHAWRLYRDLGLKPDPKLSEKIAQILFATELPVGMQDKLAGRIPLVSPNRLAQPAQILNEMSVPAASASAAQQPQAPPQAPQ